MNRVLVSPELEGVVDKENILGTEAPTLDKNICIIQLDRKLHCSLKTLEHTSGKTIICAIVDKESFPNALHFLNRKKDKTIKICDIIDIEALESSIVSLSLTRKKDMYIWKIIIDNSE